MKLQSKLAIGAAVALVGVAIFLRLKPQTDSNVEFLTFKDAKEANYGFINGAGEVLYADEFKCRPTVIMDGCFSVLEANDLYTLYSAGGKKPKALIEDISAIGMVSEGLVPIVCKDERIKVVSTSGAVQFTIEPYQDKEIVQCIYGYSEGLLAVRNEDGEWGAIDTSGKMVIAPKFHEIGQFSEGLSLADKGEGDEYKYVVIDKKGETVFKFKSSWAPYDYTYHDGYFAAIDDGRYLLIDHKGEARKCPAKVDKIMGFNEKHLVFAAEDGKRGVMRMKDFEVVLRAKYDACNLLPWDNSRFLVGNDDKYAIVNTDGEKIVDFDDEYDFVLPYQMADFAGFVASDKHDEFFFLDKDGKRIKTKTDIYELSDNLRHFSYIESEYFDINKLAMTLGNLIGRDSYDGVELGDFANKYYPRDLTPEGTQHQWTFTPEGRSYSGFRYSITPVFVTYRSIGNSTYVPGDDWYSYGSYTYDFTPDNPIERIIVRVEGPDSMWDQGREELKDTFRDKGFKLKESENELMEFANDQCTLAIEKQTYGLSLVLTSLQTFEAPAEEAVAAEAEEAVAAE